VTDIDLNYLNSKNGVIVNARTEKSVIFGKKQANGPFFGKALKGAFESGKGMALSY